MTKSLSRSRTAAEMLSVYLCPHCNSHSLPDSPELLIIKNLDQLCCVLCCFTTKHAVDKHREITVYTSDDATCILHLNIYFTYFVPASFPQKAYH